MIPRALSSEGGARFGRSTLALPAIVALLVFLMLASLFLLDTPGIEEARAGALVGWKFCIDAGHGGSDAGAIGPMGLTEKEVNLNVAFKLKLLLEEEGAEILMTRTEDAYVGISERYDMANAWGADRFISLHHNGIIDPDVNGTETLVSIYASQESLELANSVQAELVGEFGLSNRGVKRVDYCGVLNNTDMPAILTETSFMTNPEEEQRLRSDSYLMREAQAILRGIHMPSSINFILPQENVISFQDVSVDLQVLGTDDVDHVDLFVEGELLESKFSEPFSFDLNTSSMEDGCYRLRSMAWYKDGGNPASISRDLILADLARSWYFAEGTTRPGFQEWLTVLNPHLEAVEFTVTYAFGVGDFVEKGYRVEPESRLSIEVNEEIGQGHDVSVLVEAPVPIMVERPMYFLYGGKWAGGHVSSGVNQPSTTWYFAEGYTGESFEEWLCLFNSSDEEATVEVEYISSGGLLKREEVILMPWKRHTIFVNQVVGEDKDISVHLTSDHPVVAERPMYFLYGGKWAGGHVSSGATQPSTTWYFAEGYTGEGFEEYLCLFNPSQEDNLVSVAYSTSGGVNITTEVTVPPLSRETVHVNEDAGQDLQLSMEVKGSAPLVAERPVYHDYHGWCLGGDVGIGVSLPSRHWYFAEGYTGAGFETWLCIQNPCELHLEAEVRFHLESGEVLWEDVSLPPLSRVTINVNTMIPYQEGVAISVHAQENVIVERPLYFDYRGSWAGGHVSSGYAPGVKR
ncbi:MAG: N-acetylmuramoyl-L-alanine amidase [Actinomycetota bacterium]|nr:N-acetylmuramoyl-L-alanine amidase [Actinomycetota bacterium]